MTLLLLALSTTWMLSRAEAVLGALIDGDEHIGPGPSVTLPPDTVASFHSLRCLVPSA